jgi:hypothetical protein
VLTDDLVSDADTKILASVGLSRLVALAAATREMKAPRIDPGLRELVGLSLLSGGGCSLALVQGDLLFVALFGAASIIAITETIRRLR